ncbi:MAG: transposase [Candidatus Roizmanbacteria bacterium]|nr:transposase [Candidatus Roizmanbacteria bacterium]
MKFRKHIRLKEYDYSASNYYFVTVCTNYRKKLFVPRVSGKYGNLLPKNVVAASYAAKNTDVVIRTLQRLEEDYYDNFEVDFYCVMSDHIHAIFAFHDQIKRKGAIRSRNYKLSDIITAFKSLVTRQIGSKIFQPSFYEHVIRSDSSLERIRNYILHNPFVAYVEIPWKKLDPNT